VSNGYYLGFIKSSKYGRVDLLLALFTSFTIDLCISITNATGFLLVFDV